MRHDGNNKLWEKFRRGLINDGIDKQLAKKRTTDNMSSEKKCDCGDECMGARRPGDGCGGGCQCDNTTAEGGAKVSPKARKTALKRKRDRARARRKHPNIGQSFDEFFGS